MKLTILGCGTSTGVPVPGCHCPVCTSQNPRNKRLRTSALITTETQANILIDASTDFRQQALRAELSSLDAVVFTHSHADHILGIDDLRCFNFIRQQPIPCFAASETWQEIRQVFAYLFRPDPRYEGGAVAQLQVNDITDFSAITVAGIKIRPFLLWHGSKKVTGYRVGNLAYATDCNKIPEESLKILQGVEYLVLDGLRNKAHRTHFTIPEAIETARKIGPAQVFLTHMTHTVEYEETSAQLPPGIALAYDGLEIEFSA
jgi:phosphoribosyl 1,2-cyclic phosphate phosphodiesterase